MGYLPKVASSTFYLDAQLTSEYLLQSHLSLLICSPPPSPTRTGLSECGATPCSPWEPAAWARSDSSSDAHVYLSEERLSLSGFEPWPWGLRLDSSPFLDSLLGRDRIHLEIPGAQLLG